MFDIDSMEFGAGPSRLRDPLDPGPFGSFGWYRDRRTGRHRSGELPDPPQGEGAPHSGFTREGAEHRRPTPGSGRGGDGPPPRTRYRDDDGWSGDDAQRYDFGRLREDAWNSFIADSAALHLAHHVKTVGFAERIALAIRVLLSFVLELVGAPSRPTPKRPAPGGSQQRGSKPEVVEPVGSKLPKPGPLSGVPSQGGHRTAPMSAFVLEWERHFDAAYGLREVAL
ncbi:hypothetical protein [Glycomyces paridis]|uniref:Uncharacterized protein n=1 Tax=Glycomyces paridis TaxID=2126555 RepID=A0A4S8NWJ7_9ACTN|nr:hypothetical protein [Glycomyces paridis]THV22043.1 hypothetical protein E9998_23775 [Glycomyces paridis]